MRSWMPPPGWLAICESRGRAARVYAYRGNSRAVACAKVAAGVYFEQLQWGDDINIDQLQGSSHTLPAHGAGHSGRGPPR